MQVISIDDLITEAAEKYQINRDHLYKTLDCESAHFQDVKIRGDNGLARGLAQIRSDFHPEVSDAQADDPAFAIDWTAKMFADERAHEWTCWRNLPSASR